jgi:predicted membrane channel-forming protein YqfA (hemolysin III family)
MKPFLRYLELILTVVGVLVVILVFAIFRNTAPWKAAAICAIAVGVIHGIIFYTVRSKQRKARSQEVFSIRDMLDDMVANRLTTVLYPSKEGDDWRIRAQRAVWEIQARLNFIEEEGLHRRPVGQPVSGAPNEIGPPPAHP